MADRANEAEGGRGVDGIGRAGEIIVMAGVAGRGRAGVSLAVASQAAQAGVSAGQGEIGLTMVEASRIPVAGVMAIFTSRWVALGDVIFGSFIIRLVARIAERGSAGVDSIRMAGGTTGGHVRSGQGIARLRGVIEARGRPGRRIVADRARETERRRGVNGIGRSGEIIVMAGVAGRRCAGVSLTVAIQTGQARMSAGQGEIGLIVVETGIIPGGGTMA